MNISLEYIYIYMLGCIITLHEVVIAMEKNISWSRIVRLRKAINIYIYI